MFVASLRFAWRDVQCHWVGNIKRKAARSNPIAVAGVHVVLWSAALLTLIVGAEFWRG